MSLPRILLDFSLKPEYLALMREYAEVVVSDALEAPVGFDAAMANRSNANGEWMDRAGPRLRAIARAGIGVDNIDVEAATARGILVINTPDAPTESTAEHTVAMLLAISKRVVAGDMMLRSRTATRNDLLGTQVLERTLGIVGVGRIGRRVAEICAQGLRMNVIAFDPFADPASVSHASFVNSLEELLARSDFVSLNAPLTKQTRHLMNDARFAQMKPGAYLVNCARGGLVDEAALERALRSGHLAGAALDVFDPEPPPADHPLLQLPNVVATPHIASYTVTGTNAMQEGVVSQLRELFQGKRPASLVNPEVWPGRASVPR